MTAYEAYLESDAATLHARAWVQSLDDDTVFDLFEQHGPITDRFEAWCQAGAEAAAERHRRDPADEIVVIRGADLAFLAADADPTPAHGIDRPPACQTVT